MVTEVSETKFYLKIKQCSKNNTRCLKQTKQSRPYIVHSVLGKLCYPYILFFYISKMFIS